MKICWDNLEIIFLSRNGTFRNTKNGNILQEHEKCRVCKEPFLGTKTGQYCSHKCAMESEERNGKIGEIHKGRIFSEEHKLKLHIAQQNRKPISESTRKKMSDARKKNNPSYGGLSEEHKKKIGDAGRGEKSHFWKGGIAYEPYCPLWGNKEYKNWIKFERDEGECQNPLCEHKSNRLTLHHINYVKKDCRPVNLITLCNSCNSKANIDREWHTAFYQEIIRRKLI